ncbi:hypothetical protein CK203_069679 [Vitis vinifera]|uniref:Uncharacterized protein n=1 Tax=Vitis vinifera TaxID=29760 RepID=A0A438E0L3_VITVI|nr:hypothetical protein CK203_069679 [Vitis vinifera]
MGMNGDKAPGPDGFTVAFWQSYWETVKEDVLDMFKEFHEQNSFIKSVNHTFLVLLSKKGGAEDLGDYRPISLLGGLYKLLAKVMQKMGFEPKWLGWMWSCISTTKFSVLVNGVPAWFFSSSKGYVKGSSFPLFVRHGNGSAKEVEGVNEMAVEIGCRVGQLPAVYLGLPLGASNKAISVWDGVEEKVRRRLAVWKRQYISKGGRITLIKSTLSSIPLYQMSLFRMPKSVARRLKATKRFFVGRGQWGEKAHLVKWEWFARARRIFGRRCLRQSMDKRTLDEGQGRQMGCLEGDLEGVCLVLGKYGLQGGKRGGTWDQNFGQGGWSLRFLRALMMGVGYGGQLVG